MISLALLVLVAFLVALVWYVISESRNQIVDAYVGGRSDQVEIEGLVDLIERDDPELFELEVEQLVAEQLVERFGAIIDATIVELDGTERPIGTWDRSSRLEFYRSLRESGH